MRLDSDNLSKFFSLHNTGYTDPKTGIPFDFVDNKQKKLLVCIGDSWTYGSDIGNDVYKNDDDYRRNNIFGHRLSLELNADLLNLGQGGSSMFWLEQKVKELSQIIPKLEYDKIFVVCTLTEVGRAVNSHWDTEFSFIDFFSCNTLQDYFVLLSNNCVKSIHKSLSSFHHVDYRIGAAFTDQLNLIDQDNTVLPKTWLQLCAENENELYEQRCNIVSPGAISQLESILSFMPEPVRTNFHHSVIDILDVALVRANLLQKIKMLRVWHPNSAGHKLWCDYIMENFTS